MKIKNIFLILTLIIFSNKVQALENCNWDNQKGIHVLLSLKHLIPHLTILRALLSKCSLKTNH